MPEFATLEEALRARDLDAFTGAVEVAVERGDEGERALVEALSEVSGWRQVVVLAALGDARGRLGLPALVGVYPTLSTRDGKCAALTALAKRGHSGATPHLLQGLRDRDAWVRDYAVFALAAVGDASAWDAVFERLAAMTRSKRTQAVEPSPVATAVAYLLATGDDRQVAALATAMRGWWTRLSAHDRSALTRLWSPLDPAGPSPDDHPRPRSEDLRAAAHELVTSPATGPDFD